MAAVRDLVRHARADVPVRARAIPLLVERLQDTFPGVRSAAAVGLGDLEATDAISALLVTASDDDAHVCQMALNALGEIGDERVLGRLRRALKDQRPEVRYQAIIAFPRVVARAGAADASEVDDALFEAVVDPDDAVAHVALRVAEERLDAGQRPDGRLLARARTLVDRSAPSPHIVLAAAILLAKAGDERGFDVVRRVVRGDKLAGQPPEKEDERAAVELAGELGLTDLVPHLERRTWGVAKFVRDTCAFHARIALARMGHDRARSEIMSDLASARHDARSGAVVSAGRAKMHEARDAIVRLSADAVDPELRREAVALLETDDGNANAARS